MVNQALYRQKILRHLIMAKLLKKNKQDGSCESVHSTECFKILLKVAKTTFEFCPRNPWDYLKATYALGKNHANPYAAYYTNKRQHTYKARQQKETFILFFFGNWSKIKVCHCSFRSSGFFSLKLGAEFLRQLCH